jgi:hypothetical protein
MAIRTIVGAVTKHLRYVYHSEIAHELSLLHDGSVQQPAKTSNESIHIIPVVNKDMKGLECTCGLAGGTDPDRRWRRLVAFAS